MGKRFPKLGGLLPPINMSQIGSSFLIFRGENKKHFELPPAGCELRFSYENISVGDFGGGCHSFRNHDIGNQPKRDVRFFVEIFQIDLRFQHQL